MLGIPKSVAVLNRWPYPFAKYQLGTRFYQWVQLLRNLFDKNLSGVLGNPTVIQNTGVGGNTQMEHGAFDYIIDDQVYSVVTTDDIAVDASANTAAGEFKALLLSIDAAGALTQTASAAQSVAPAPAPAVPSGDAPVAVVQIPVSFTTGVTVFLTAWVSNGYPGRITVVKPAALSDTDI